MNGTKPFKFALRGVMDVTKRYKFICCGVMDAIKPFKFIQFGDQEREGRREGGRTQRDPRDGAKHCLINYLQGRHQTLFNYLQGCPCRVYPPNADHGHLHSDAFKGSFL